jgi:hypothetical protein
MSVLIGISSLSIQHIGFAEGCALRFRRVRPAIGEAREPAALEFSKTRQLCLMPARAFEQTAEALPARPTSGVGVCVCASVVGVLVPMTQGSRLTDYECCKMLAALPQLLLQPARQGFKLSKPL